MDKVILNPNDISSWIKLLLFPVCILHARKSSSKERSGTRQKLQVASISHALALWREPDGCRKLVLKLLEDSEQHNAPREQSRKKEQVDINRRLCRKKISHGSYTAAIRVLTSNGVAPQNEATLKELQQKHPQAPLPTLPTTPIEVDAAVASKDLVIGRIRSFPKGTSCGRDGLHAQHFIDALSGSAAAVADEFLTSTTDIVNLLLSGKCPPQLGEFIASAPLTPLLKPDGGIRPIAVGTIWRRLVSKVAATKVCKDMTAYLSDFQFGVGIPCGSEAILHSVNRLLVEKGTSNSMSMLLVDFRNAFNLVDRSAMIREVRRKCPAISRWVEFCYNSPARLYYGAETLSSAQGVQQGDPLGPLLFSLTLHPLLLKIAQQCSLDLHAWYLDDGTIIGDTMMVSKALEIIKSEGVSVGLDLNINKTEPFWPTTDESSRLNGVFPAGIGRPTVGVKLLGGPVSLDVQFCNQLTLSRVSKTMQLMDAIHTLDDPQSELLLLRSCAGVSKLYFTMRTTAPTSLREAHVTFDNHLSTYLRDLVTGDGPGFGQLQQRLSSLPIRDGGLGIYTMADTIHYCYLASCLQTEQLQETILHHSGITGKSPTFLQALDTYIQVCGIESSALNVGETAPHPMNSLAVHYFDSVKKKMPTQYNMTARDLVLWECNRTKHAQDYLLAVPIEGLGQKIGARQFCAVLGYRLGIPLFQGRRLCPCCSREMDIYGDHALHCAKEVGLKFRHDLVRDTLADMCFRAGVHAKTEVALGFLAHDGGELRPADILVYNWDNGRDMCLDVTGISPFTGGIQTFTPGHAVAKAVRRKESKYLDQCQAHGYSFGTLAFTTLGELGDETVEFLIRLKNHTARHSANPKIGNFLFHRIGLVIQKAVGAQLVARLPTSFLSR